MCLRGIVQTRGESNDAARVANSVDGVTGVKNELRVTEEIRSRRPRADYRFSRRARVQ